MITTTDNYYYKNYRIYYTITKAKTQSTTGVLFIHGKGGHSGYFNNIINYKMSDYIFFALDLPGFGKSSGKRGHIKSFTIYFAIVYNFIQDIIIDKNNINTLFIAGESVGSLIAFCVSNKYTITILKGLIFIPGLYDIEDFHKIHKKLILFLLNLFYPLKNLKGHRSITTYTNNLKFQTIVKNDPLWERNKSIRFVSEINKYINYIQKEIKNCKYPILIFHGKGDIYNNGPTTDMFYRKIPFSPHNKLVYLNNSKHWLIIDSETNIIKNEMYNWMNSFI